MPAGIGDAEFGVADVTDRANSILCMRDAGAPHAGPRILFGASKLRPVDVCGLRNAADQNVVTGHYAHAWRPAPHNDAM